MERKVWVIRDNEKNIQVADNAMAAYNFCRQYIKNLTFESEFEEENCLNDLAHSYSDSRASFGVEGIIDVVAVNMITEDNVTINSNKKDRLEVAKEVIKKYINNGDCGIFSTRNNCGDHMEILYKGDDLTIDICYYYHYFEVFGLNDNEFVELEKFYNELRGE